MLGNRRPPPQIVLALSLMLGALTAAAAYRYASAENWLPAALWGGVALWLVIDAVRAFGWVRGSGAGPQASGPGQQAGGAEPLRGPGGHPTSAVSARPPVDTSPTHTGAPVNPLLQPGAERSGDAEPTRVQDV